MKRLAVVFIVTLVMLVLVIFAAVGCADKEAGPTPEVVSSCVTCHTDKDILQEVATTELEEVHSEATSGEG